MKQLYAPNGKRIIGTSEMIPGTAIVNGWSDTGEPIYSGETDTHWNGQLTSTNKRGVMLVTDEDGQEHAFDACTLRDDGAAMRESHPATVDAEGIKAAAQRMQAAGVMIDVEPEADKLNIDARSLDGIPDEGVFSLEGESAANLISEARAYCEIFPATTFNEALAFLVEGRYLEKYKK